MVDPISSSSATPWSPPAPDADEDARRRAATATRPRPAVVPDPPELPDVHAALLVRAAQAAAAIDLATMLRDRGTPLQQRLQVFFDAAKPTYRVPVGDNEAVEVEVAAPFRIAVTRDRNVQPPRGRSDPLVEAPRRRYEAQETTVRGHHDELQAIARRIGIPSVEEIVVGRGTPAQVQALTQALLYANKLPPPQPGESLEVRVRRMMCDYGIGFDCSGYVQRAFLSAHGVTRAQAGFGKVINESLSGLSRPRFSRVAPEDSRPGDILSLGPPPLGTTGHRLIVFDAHEASPAELDRYSVHGAGALDEHVTVLVVDSSFGSGGDPAKGGLERQTWLYEAASKRWGVVSPARVEGTREFPENVTMASMPYDGVHPLIGVFHYSEKH
jgi:hypothetical protein